MRRLAATAERLLYPALTPAKGWMHSAKLPASKAARVDELCLTIGNEFPDADFTQTARQVGRAARTPPKSRATSLIFDTPAQNWHR